MTNVYDDDQDSNRQDFLSTVDESALERARHLIAGSNPETTTRG